MILKPNSFKDIFIHLGVMVVIGVLLVLIFFKWYLPDATNHGETITVPDLEGQHIDQIADELSTRGLLFEISSDSGFSSDHQPLTVLKQYPKPHSLVKEKRKIYLTLNAQNPPKVKMPDLINLSLKIAEIKLKSLGLEKGDISYEPDLAHNAVLKQMYKGKEVVEGTPLFKGTVIDLVVGDGYGKTKFPVDDLVGRQLEDVEYYLAGSGLKLGTVIDAIEIENDTLPIGTVVQQAPAAGEEVRIGEIIDLWVVGYEEYQAEREESDSDGVN